MHKQKNGRQYYMPPLNHCQRAVRCEHYMWTVARHCRIVHSHGRPIRNSLHMSLIEVVFHEIHKI